MAAPGGTRMTGDSPRAIQDEIIEWLCSCLRGEPAAGAPPADVDALWAEIAAHGVGPLLFDALTRASALDRCPEDVAGRLRRSAREHAALEILRREELIAVLDALAAARVRLLLMKGTPLAYTHYPAPELRVREDTDALLERDRLDAAVNALAGLGYRRALSIDGELVMQQLQMSRADGFGVHHALDLHWKVSNPHLFAAVLDFDELWSVSVAVPALGPHARALGDAHALLLACMHRVAHHDASDRLVWLYDIHLLADALDAGGRARFAQMAAAKSMTGVCADGLALASARFHGRAARELADEVAARAPAGDEPSARYLHRHRRGAALLWDDLRALPHWRQRLRLLREHAFPSARYIRGRFGQRPAWQLPWLYLKRGATGLRRLLLPRRSS